MAAFRASVILAVCSFVTGSYSMGLFVRGSLGLDGVVVGPGAGYKGWRGRACAPHCRYYYCIGHCSALRYITRKGAVFANSDIYATLRTLLSADAVEVAAVMLAEARSSFHQPAVSVGVCQHVCGISWMAAVHTPAGCMLPAELWVWGKVL